MIYIYRTNQEWYQFLKVNGITQNVNFLGMIGEYRALFPVIISILWIETINNLWIETINKL